MEICNQCNIVYDVKNCPLCEAEERIEALEEQLDNAEDEIKELQTAIEVLNEKAKEIEKCR